MYFGERRGIDADPEFRLDQRMRLAFRGAVIERADIERRMRPGRLREILDDAGDLVVAFDQQHVAGAERRRQCGRIARRKRLVARNGLLQIPGKHLPEAVEHVAHAFPRHAREVLASSRFGVTLASEPLRFGSRTR